jgi:hypothetical protein
VKPRISSDLLRGVLTVYAAHEGYMWAIISPSMTHKHASNLGLALVVTAVLIGIHLFALVGLLIQRAPKAVFVCLLLSVAAAFLPLVRSRFGGFPSADAHLAVRSVAFWLVHIAAAVVAYAYYRATAGPQRSNQAMERTPDRS